MKVHTIKTSTLKLAYEEGGPADGKPQILLHGWPDSPRTWDGVGHFPQQRENPRLVADEVLRHLHGRVS